MRAHLAYLRYVLIHKFYVLWGGIRLDGIPLWQLVIHDASKFSKVEWLPYVRQFYNADGSQRRVRDATGAYDPSVQSEAFKAAWLHHWKNNPHHPQYWIANYAVRGEKKHDVALPMPDVYIREMVIDWFAAGMAQGKPDCMAWYAAQKDKLVLHSETRIAVERVLQEAKDKGIIP